jgi:hypothetical protein
VRPEERGPTAQLAEELERAAELAEACASVPQQVPAQAPKAEGAAGAGDMVERFIPPAHARPMWPWLTLAAVGVALSLWTWLTVSSPPGERSSVADAESGGEGALEAEPTGLGETAAAASLEEAPHSLLHEVMAKDAPPEPQPGQTRPDAKGRCPHKAQVALNRGCWLQIALEPERCAELKGQLFKGLCYLPFIPPGRPPTSSPTDKP